MNLKIILITFLFYSNITPAEKKPTLNFEKTSISLGKIAQGVPISANFSFYNRGNIPLIIQQVKATCGCTATDYTQEPIKPGKKGFIKVTYNAATTGPFHKTIAITSNSSQSPVDIAITGEVLKRK